VIHRTLFCLSLVALVACATPTGDRAAPRASQDRTTGERSLSPPSQSGEAPTARVEIARVQIGYPAVSLSQLPMRVAEVRGFFLDEALDVTFIRMGSNVAIPALAARELDFLTATGSVVRASAVQDFPLRVVLISAVKPLHTLHVRDEIRTPADLRGRTLAVSSVGATQDLFTRRVLLGLGLQPDRDVGIVPVGPDAPRLAAMEQNLVQGTLLPPPANVQAELQGFRMLAHAADFVDMPQAGLGLQVNTLQERPEVVRRVLRASVRGLHYVHQEREGTIAVIQEWTEADPPSAVKAYELSLPSYSHNGIFTDKSVDEDLQLAREEGALPHDKVVTREQVRDMAPLRAVLREMNVPE
jgi:NitT/TauT family transport system substrate-binding protein